MLNAAQLGPSQPRVAVIALRDGTKIAAAGTAVRGLPGVLGIATDLGRQQLVVRFDARVTAASVIKAAVREQVGAPRDPWLELLPRVARALPVATALL